MFRGYFRKRLFKENMQLLIFISVIIQWYFKRKHFTAFYWQGLNSGGVGGAGEKNINMLLQAQHTKHPSFDWNVKIKCYSVTCADVQNIIILKKKIKNKGTLKCLFWFQAVPKLLFFFLLCCNDTEPCEILVFILMGQFVPPSHHA